jgi:hypothetical protein
MRWTTLAKSEHVIEVFDSFIAEIVSFSERVNNHSGADLAIHDTLSNHLLIKHN